MTRMPTGVAGIKWFPDSRRVAFISWVWPDAIGYKALEARYKEYKDDKVKAHVVEHEAYRYWDHWLSDGRVPRLFVVDVASERITRSLRGHALRAAGAPTRPRTTTTSLPTGARSRSPSTRPRRSASTTSTTSWRWTCARSASACSRRARA